MPKARNAVKLVQLITAVIETYVPDLRQVTGEVELILLKRMVPLPLANK